MIKYIIDRFENNWTIIETAENPSISFALPKNILPKNSKEGDVLNINITTNKEETLKNKKIIQGKLDSLKKKGGGDDLAL